MDINQDGVVDFLDFELLQFMVDAGCGTEYSLCMLENPNNTFEECFCTACGTCE